MSIETLPLADMHKRHYGLTPGIAETYYEAARICLDRHHKPPEKFELQDDGNESVVYVEWLTCDKRERAAYNNNIDATEMGAYACAIAAVEVSRGMYTVMRAETLTGADYYVAPSGYSADDIEDCYRLEVSGTDGERAAVTTRLKRKVQQVRDGQSNLPALAAVVGFYCKLITIQSVD